MEFKGTKGEWFTSHREIPNDEDGMFATQVYDDKGETIATLAWYQMPPRKEVINGENKIVTGTYRTQNAKLIAAAPDLLKELEDCLFMLEGLGVQDSSLESVKKAIEKALK